MSGCSDAEGFAAAATREHLLAGCAAVEVEHLSCAGTHEVITCTGTRVLQQGRQRQERAAGSQQEERQTQGLAIRADLTDTDLFPHGKVIEISAP